MHSKQKVSPFFHLPLVMVLLVSFMISCGCSGGKSPVEPATSDFPPTTGFLPDLSETANSSVLAVYDAVIDPVAQTFSMTPSAREALYHFPLNNLHPGCLRITDYGFSPNFWADIKLVHPIPGSGIDAFDPRVIAIIPVHAGAYFHYPTLGVFGNPRVVMEADGYTRLHDELAPEIFGNVNPFIAYFKDQQNRRWSSTGTTEETRRWEMDLDGFGGSVHFKLVVDVSTNHPNPPTPVIDNASEPIEIDAAVGNGLTPDGGCAGISVTLLDWQGSMTIGGVLVESPSLFDGSINLAYASIGPNPNEYVYSGIIINEKLAPVGDYNFLVDTWDRNSGTHIYDEFELTVSELPTSGDLMWAKRAGGTNFDTAHAVTSLSDDSAVVTGYFIGTATFGNGEPGQVVLNSAGNHDIFIAGYNPDGSLAWAKRAGSMNDDMGYGITALSDDSFIVTGYFYNNAVFGPGEPNETILYSVTSSDYDIFIAKYNPDGTLVWAKSAGGWHYDFGLSITALSDDSTVAIGYFLGDATFGKDEPNETTLSAEGERDIFVAQYNPDGTLAWAKRIGGNEEDIPGGITSLSDNSTVVTGYYETSATFGHGEPNETILTSFGEFDIFIARYNIDGTLAWVENAGGITADDESHAVTVLSDNSIAVTGTFGGDATFGSGDPGEIVLTADGGSDMFIARYSSDGVLIWAKRAGGEENYDLGYGITTLSNNSMVVTGSYYGTAVFGEGEPNETILISPAGDEIFVARYNPNGTLEWAKHAGGANFYNIGWGITSLSDDSTVVTGTFYTTSVFGPGEPNEISLTSAGYTDIFVARFEP